MTHLLEKNPLFQTIPLIEEKSTAVTAGMADELLKEIDFSFKEVLKKRKRVNKTDMEKQDFFSDAQVQLIGALCQVAKRLPEKEDAVVSYIKNMNLLCQNTDDASLLKSILDSYHAIPMSPKQAVGVMEAIRKTKKIALHSRLVLILINEVIMPAVQSSDNTASSPFKEGKEKASFLLGLETFLETAFPLSIKLKNKPIILGIVKKMKEMDGQSTSIASSLEGALKGKESINQYSLYRNDPVTRYVKGNTIATEDGVCIVVTPQGNTFIREGENRSRRHSYPDVVANRKIKKDR